MSNLSKSIIGKIKKEKVKPTPKWVFLFKHSVVWGLFTVSVLLGSIAVSIIFFQYRDATGDLYGKIGCGVSEFILLALPYFWIVLMIAFLALAYYHFRHTQKGYRYNVFAIIGLSLFISIVLGSVLHAIGFSEKLENLFQEIPHYEKLHFGKRMLWQKPNAGRLAGAIIQIEDDKVLILQDFNKNVWWVETENAQKHPAVILEKGERIRSIGERLEDGYFRADIIAPWRKRLIPPMGIRQNFKK